MIFETHAHYDDDAFDRDRVSLLKLLKEEGINPIINVSSSLESTRKALEMTHKYEHIYAAIGVHPSECEQLTEKDMEWLNSLCSDDKVVAIGEIGLDYHYDEPDKNIQEKWFVRQIELARGNDLPIVVHSRDAAADTFDILSRKEFCGQRGVIHCFSYSAQMAAEYVKMGYYIGVGGVVTFKNGHKLHEVVRTIPLENIVVETDAPYLSPEPYRGRRNSSAYIPYIIERIAALKELSYKDVERAVYDNAAALYGVKADEQTG